MAETGKQLRRGSGSSSDESEAGKDEGGCTMRRSFECTYCKRGFTNAQALGGHMNIHRKDRAKGKQSNASVGKGNSCSDDRSYMMSSMSSSNIDTGYANWEGQRMMSSHGPAAVSGMLNLGRPGHELGPNLSLRVGPAASDDIEDVDLELRLGPR